jgi:hypothetical protein
LWHGFERGPLGTRGLAASFRMSIISALSSIESGLSGEPTHAT